ncbi:hypothetical protein H0H81_005423 [Sphagnurus paluster]|uniref:Alpha-type protein kinase domain-containing protein n=1 Tax=Sphagnurus paluster TaxID=117069 RepID=A0A9P7GH67_9AGAR|nr:hypothetical protein H0H81_005423 [Sphagnurus paluster]
MDSKLFVAKKFFEIGSDDSVTADENAEFLKCELIRLKTATWFLKKFNAAAKEMKVDIATNIILSEGFLAREVGTPLEASGLDAFEEGSSAVWLVEPHQTKTVLKFSGTLNHLNRQDKVGTTISSFAHFSYQVSNQELIFADIQGSPMNIQGRDTIVLFDIMSHLPTSDSGIGDHGPDGIKSFISQHHCNYMCQGLKLRPLLEKEDDPADSEESCEEDDNADNNEK